MEMVILAAGKGERLRPITDVKPKPMIRILDKTIIERIIESSYTMGVKRFVVVAEYRYDILAKHLSRIAERLGTEISIVRQKTELGTGHALLEALPSINSDDPIVVYGDLYVSENALKRVIESPPNSLLGIRVADPSSYGLLHVRDGVAYGIDEKPSKPKFSGPYLINGGIYRFSKEALKYLEDIEPSPRGEIELTDLINHTAKMGFRFKVVEASYYDDWIDIGRPWNILDVHERLLKDLRNKVVKGRVSPSAEIKGPVYIEDGAEVKGCSIIEGPAYIDRNATIGPNSYIRPYTYIGEGSKIGFSVEVKNSVIYEDARIPHLSYIGDSVICEGVNFGAGTLIANLRFDENPVKVTVKGERLSSGRKKLGAFIGAYVKTGINSSILPGVKVGAYSVIYPGVVVGRDVDYGSVVRSNII